MYLKPYFFNINRIKQAIFLGLEQYSAIYDKNNKLEFLILLTMSKINSMSLKLVFIYQDVKCYSDKDKVLDYINWSINKYSESLKSKKFTRLDIYYLNMKNVF